MVDDYNASIPLGFLVLGELLAGFFLARGVRLSSGTQIRGVRYVVVSAIAILACVAAAGARQSSTSDSAEKKPVATQATSHKHHKTKAPARSKSVV